MEILVPILLASALLASIALLLKYRREAGRYRAKAALLSAAVERIAAEAEALSGSLAAELERAHRMISMYVAERADVRSACAEVERERERLGREARELAGRLAACEEAKGKLADELASLASGALTARAEEVRPLWFRFTGHYAAKLPMLDVKDIWVRVPMLDFAGTARAVKYLARRHGIWRSEADHIARAMAKTAVLIMTKDGRRLMTIDRALVPAYYIADFGIIVWRPAPWLSEVFEDIKKEEEGYR